MEVGGAPFQPHYLTTINYYLPNQQIKEKYINQVGPHKLYFAYSSMIPHVRSFLNNNFLVRGIEFRW